MGDPLLDPNHTHFILVDDGSDSNFGVEIKLRARLESELRKGKSLRYYAQRRSSNVDSDDSDQEDNSGEVDNTIPMILIVVQGGPNTLKTVAEGMKKKIPILILVVNNR